MVLGCSRRRGWCTLWRGHFLAVVADDVRKIEFSSRGDAMRIVGDALNNLARVILWPAEVGIRSRRYTLSRRMELSRGAYHSLRIVSGPLWRGQRCVRPSCWAVRRWPPPILGVLSCGQSTSCGDSVSKFFILCWTGGCPRATSSSWRSDTQGRAFVASRGTVQWEQA